MAPTFSYPLENPRTPKINILQASQIYQEAYTWLNKDFAVPSLIFATGNSDSMNGLARNGAVLVNAMLKYVPAGHTPTSLKAFYGDNPREELRCCTGCGKRHRGLGNTLIPDSGLHCTVHILYLVYVLDISIMFRKERISPRNAQCAIKQAIEYSTQTREWCDEFRRCRGNPTRCAPLPELRLDYTPDTTIEERRQFLLPLTFAVQIGKPFDIRDKGKMYRMKIAGLREPREHGFQTSLHGKKCFRIEPVDPDVENYENPFIDWKQLQYYLRNTSDMQRDDTSMQRTTRRRHRRVSGYNDAGEAEDVDDEDDEEDDGEEDYGEEDYGEEDDGDEDDDDGDEDYEDDNNEDDDEDDDDEDDDDEDDEDDDDDDEDDDDEDDDERNRIRAKRARPSRVIIDDSDTDTDEDELIPQTKRAKLNNGLDLCLNFVNNCANHQQCYELLAAITQKLQNHVIAT